MQFQLGCWNIATWLLRTISVLLRVPRRILSPCSALTLTWYNNKRVLYHDTVHKISWGESVAAGLTTAPAADSQREIWWNVSHNYTVLFLSRDVKNTNSINIYPWIWRRLTCQTQDFGNLFRRWLHHGVALWRHGCEAWHNCLLLTTASNVN